jgi:hypothetical protein
LRRSVKQRRSGPARSRSGRMRASPRPLERDADDCNEEHP